MIWWCTQCNQQAHPEAWAHQTMAGVPATHRSHKEKLIGIRDDILQDSMKRLVADLKRTGRAELFK